MIAGIVDGTGLFILCVLLLVVLALCISRYDTTHFSVSRYEVELEGMKSPLRLCILSDIHDQIYEPENLPLTEAVREASPDIIILAGDLLTAHRNPAHMQPDRAIALVRTLCAIAPVYIAEGNHEHKLRTYTGIYGDLYERYTSALRETGAVLLRDGDVLLEDAGVHLRGLDADERFFRKLVRTPMSQEYLTGELGEPDTERADILVAHHPWYFPEYARWGAGLVISGHIHGGIVRLPWIGGVISPTFRFFPRYDGGCYRLGSSQLIVSRGLGTHTIRFRLFNRGDLVVATIRPGHR